MEILPASPERWADLEDLFGPERGGCAGCWCVWPRVSAKEFKELGKPGRSTGNVTRRKVCNAVAPDIVAASSSAGDMPRNVAESCRNTNGAVTKDWQTIRPHMEKTLSGPEPVSPSSARTP